MNELYRFIEPVGITTLVFLLSTLALGLNVHRNRKVLLPWHKRLALLRHVWLLYICCWCC